MTEFKLIPFTDHLTKEWDDIVNKSKNGNFLHLRGFLGYHANRFNEQSLIIHKDNKSVGVFPCNRVDDQIISHAGITYAGLIYGNDMRTADIIQIFDLILAYFRRAGCNKLIYKAIPHIFHRYPAEEDLYALTRNGAKVIRRDLSTVVKLSNKLKTSKSREGSVKKAQKHGVYIEEGVFFVDFHRLLSDVLYPKGLCPVHTIDELLLLKSRFPQNIRLFGAFKDTTLISASLIFDFGDSVHTQYMASSNEGRLCGALDFLLVHLLDNVFRDRGYFSFGISTEQQGHYLNEGLLFQKEGFGGRAVVHDIYECVL